MFCRAIARSNETNAWGEPVSSSEYASARRSIARDRRFEIKPTGADTSAAASASAGSAAGVSRAFDRPQLRRWVASAAAGATIPA